MNLLRRLLSRRNQHQNIGEPLSVPGAYSASGIFSHLGEYNPELKPPRLYKIIDQMRNNSRIAALEHILTLPVVSTIWEIRPPDNASSLAQRASNELNTNLFRDANKTLYELIRLGILARLYGVRFVEPVWDIKDDLAWIQDYIDLHPNTYFKFEVDERGRLTALIQLSSRPNQSTTTEIRVPADRLIRFTWREEGGNFLGYPDLRSLYADWYRLETIYTILQIASERAGVGAWQARIPRDLWDNPQFVDQLKSILREIRTSKAGALVVPDGVAIEVLKAVQEQGMETILKLVDKYETNLATGILANILQLGMRDVGTQALGSVLFELYLYQLNQTARWIANTLQRQLINRWLAYNYPQLPPNQRPTLHYADLRILLKREAVVDVISKAIQSGTITAEPITEDYIRDLLGLPPLPQSPTTEQPLSRFLQNQTPPTPYKLARANSFEATIKSHMQQILASIQPQLESTLKAIRSADPAQQSLLIAQLNSLTIPLQDRYAELIYDWLVRFAVEARRKLKQELNLDIDPALLPPPLQTWLQVRAHTLARDHYEHLRAELIYNTLDLALADSTIPDIAGLTRTITNNRLSDLAKDLPKVGQSLIQKINTNLENLAR